jgi:murein DD-endopeptidase MepM/ murein hydrolase activator NlpD
MLGFGRDAPVTAALSATTAVGMVSTTVDVGARSFNVQSIPGLAKTPVPDAEFAARRPAELAAIAAARSGVTVSDGWTQSFAWPAKGPVSGVFGSQRIYAGVPGSAHAGVDLAVPAGTPIHAPADGVVRLAQGPFTLEGNLVMIDHGYGLISAFLHLSQINVTAGQRVAQGDIIGRVGGTGRATGPHLHWGMTWGTGATLVRIDPQLLVPPQPSAKPGS